MRLICLHLQIERFFVNVVGFNLSKIFRSLSSCVTKIVMIMSIFHLFFKLSSETIHLFQEVELVWPPAKEEEERIF